MRRCLVTDAQEVEIHLRDQSWGEDDWVKQFNGINDVVWNTFDQEFKNKKIRSGLNYRKKIRLDMRKRIRKNINEITYYFHTQPKSQVTQIKRELILKMVAAICGIVVDNSDNSETPDQPTNFMKEIIYNEDFDNPPYLLNREMLFLLDEMVRIINRAYNDILGKASDSRVTPFLSEMKWGLDHDPRLHNITNIVLRERARAFSLYDAYLQKPKKRKRSLA
jgi:hypothetical protein